MFEVISHRPVDGMKTEIVDATRLRETLAGLSDAELEKLADELDFCAFAGLPSTRILSVLDKVTDLDDGWAAQLDRGLAQAA